MPLDPAKQSYTITEAAEYLGASVRTIQRWTEEDKLDCWRTPGNQRRFTREMLERFMGATT